MPEICPLCKYEAKNEFALGVHIKKYCEAVKGKMSDKSSSPPPPPKNKKTATAAEANPEQQKKNKGTTLYPVTYRKRKTGDTSVAAEAVSIRKQPMRNFVVLMCETCWGRHHSKAGSWNKYEKDVNSPRLITCDYCAEKNMKLWMLQNDMHVSDSESDDME